MNEPLDETQLEAFQELLQALQEKTSRLPEINSEKSTDLMIDPNFSNVFAVLGPRGAGKSTVLDRFFRSAAKGRIDPLDAQLGSMREQLQNLRQSIWFLPPIDCSVIPSDVYPGTAVLLHGWMEYERLNQDMEPSWRQLGEELQRLLESQGRATPSYRELWMEVAAAPDDYLVHMAQATRKRFQLRQEIADWTSRLLGKIHRRALVVLLDDFDLVTSREIQLWKSALLDELHQERVFFLLTADLYRLQHLAGDSEIERDLKTGLAVLHKLLPPRQRIELQPWRPATRVNFVQKSGKITELIPRITAGTSLEMLVYRLLPSLPRGLSSLRQELEGRSLSNSDSEEPRHYPLQGFLAVLATCREEPLLARRLSNTEPTEWIDRLEFPPDPLAIEDWYDTVDAARQRSQATNALQLTPLRGLLPLSFQTEMETGSQLQRWGAGSRAGEEVLLRTARTFLREIKASESTSTDQLWVAPLRDATPADQPLWAELLLCLALTDPVDPPRSTETTEPHPAAPVARRRLRFLHSWAPLSRRLEACQLQVETSLDEARQLIAEQETVDYFDTEFDQAPLRALLFWMHWHIEKPEDSKKAGKQPSATRRLHADIGWPPLLDALREARDPLMPEQLSDLNVNYEKITGSTPALGVAETLSFLPGEPWAMVLLVDGLDRCPWRMFSVKRGLKLSTHLQLAGAFVAAAYLYALEACPPAAEAEPDANTPLDELLSMLRQRNSDAWRSLQEVELLRRLRAIFKGDLLQQRADAAPKNELRRAARAFLQADVFKAVRALALAER